MIHGVGKLRGIPEGHLSKGNLTRMNLICRRTETQKTNRVFKLDESKGFTLNRDEREKGLLGQRGAP